MQQISYHASLVAKPCLNDIEQFVDNFLLRDWIIRIQHTYSVTPNYTYWQQWDETLYAIQNSSIVIDRIIACRTSYPAHAIRIYAEKYRPQVYFTYLVYSLNETAQAPATDKLPAFINIKQHSWFANLKQKFSYLRARVWRVMSIIVALFASIFVLQELLA